MSYKIAPSLRDNEFFTIQVLHVPTLQYLSFEGWVTQFSDDFTSTWSQESVYGRMDPLATFQNTQRRISLAFDVPMDNQAMAGALQWKIGLLIQYLYPVYTDGNTRSARQTLKAAPLIGLQWTSLINNNAAGGGETAEWLYGYLGGVNYSPDMGEGGFVSGKRFRIDPMEQTTDPAWRNVGGGDILHNQNLRARAAGSRMEVDSTTTPPPHWQETSTTTSTPRIQTRMSYVPKKINLSLDFTVVHTHLTGWTRSAVQGGEYSFGNPTDPSDGFPTAARTTTRHGEASTAENVLQDLGPSPYGWYEDWQAIQSGETAIAGGMICGLDVAEGMTWEEYKAARSLASEYDDPRYAGIGTIEEVFAKVDAEEIADDDPDDDPDDAADDDEYDPFD